MISGLFSYHIMTADFYLSVSQMKHVAFYIDRTFHPSVTQQLSALNLYLRVFIRVNFLQWSAKP